MPAFPRKHGGQPSGIGDSTVTFKRDSDQNLTVLQALERINQAESQRHRLRGRAAKPDVLRARAAQRRESAEGYAQYDKTIHNSGGVARRVLVP